MPSVTLPVEPLLAPRVEPKLSPSIPFIEPELPPLSVLQEDFERIYASGTFSNGGPFERELSQRMSDYLGVPHAIPVANATVGLMLAVKALARPGRRRVLMPAFTFVATPLAAQWAGLEPLFCDADLGTWQARVDEQALKARADELALILVCNTFGAPLDLERWRHLAQALDVPLLIDSAPGLGAFYADGRRQGQSGTTEVFSMHATKPFGIGEGGLITTYHDGLAERMRRMRNFGFGEERTCEDLGLNAKMSEFHAAIACRVLDRLDWTCDHRRARAAEYRERLEPLGFTFQVDGTCSAYQFLPTLTPTGVSPQALRLDLERAGIEVRHYFQPPLHQHPHFRGLPTLGPLPHTEELSRRALSLPMSNRLTRAEVVRICDALEQSLERES